MVATMAGITFTRSQTPDLVSIIIPTYRCEQYIGETLDSISHQTYDNWEVIVVEDGQAGPTQAIVEDFARRHPSHRVEYSASGKNYGPSHSRNVAFAKAAGEFIALLDSDDRWFPDHLARSVRELCETGKDLAYSTVITIEDMTDRILGTWGPEARDLEDLPNRLFNRNFISPSATVFRRRVLGIVGAWDSDLRYCEDLSFWLRCYAAGVQFHYVGGCHCLYRKNHAGAATQKQCATLEMFAVVAQRYMHLPGLRRKIIGRFVAKAYVRAADAHVKADPTRDPSADRSRALPLLLRAWRIRPTAPMYLVKAIKIAIAEALRGRRPTSLAPVAPYVLPATGAQESMRLAA